MIKKLVFFKIWHTLSVLEVFERGLGSWLDFNQKLSIWLIQNQINIDQNYHTSWSSSCSLSLMEPNFNWSTDHQSNARSDLTKTQSPATGTILMRTTTLLSQRRAVLSRDIPQSRRSSEDLTSTKSPNPRLPKKLLPPLLSEKWSQIREEVFEFMITFNIHWKR